MAGFDDAGIDQLERHGGEDRHQDQVQAEDGGVHAPQVHAPEDAGELPAVEADVTMAAPTWRRRHQLPQHKHPQRRQQGGEVEHPGQAKVAGHQRAEHHGDAKGHADRQADGRHGGGAHLLAGLVGQKRHDGGGHRTAALQTATDNHHGDGVRLGGDHAADQKQPQASSNHRLAPDAIRQQTEGNLQYRLGQAIDAERQPHQQRGGPDQVVGVEGEHGQHHEQPEHACGVEPRQTDDGAPLGG